MCCGGDNVPKSVVSPIWSKFARRWTSDMLKETQCQVLAAAITLNLSTTSVRAKQLSDDESFLIQNHSFLMMPTAEEMEKSLQPNDYAACLYDGYWWVVLIDTVNLDNKDVTCKFMHPHAWSYSEQ